VLGGVLLDRLATGFSSLGMFRAAHNGHPRPSQVSIPWGLQPEKQTRANWHAYLRPAGWIRVVARPVAGRARVGQRNPTRRRSQPPRPWHASSEHGGRRCLVESADSTDQEARHEQTPYRSGMPFVVVKGDREFALTYLLSRRRSGRQTPFSARRAMNSLGSLSSSRRWGTSGSLLNCAILPSTGRY
jgi:hypothetical protein